MLNIQLQSMVLENFQSYKAETIEQFPEQGGFYFLSGKNEREPRLGPNGAGKSTLFNALVWCLYGVTAKGSKTSDVLSWGAKKVCVSVILAIGDVSYVITREGPPERLYIDEARVEQKDVDYLVGLSRLRFLHSVVFGQDCRLFIDLPVADRAVLLDEVLDLSIWQTLSDAAKTKVKGFEQQIETARREVARLQGGLASHDTTALEHLRDTWETNYAAETAMLVMRLEEKEKAVLTLHRQLQDAQNVYDKHLKEQEGVDTKRLKEISAKSRELLVKVGAERAVIDSAKKDIRFYSHTKTCSACGQAISATFAEEKLRQANTALRAAEKLIEQINKQVTSYDIEAHELTDYNSKLSKQVIEATAALRTVKNDHTRLTAECDELARTIETRLDTPPVNPFNAEIANIERQKAAVSAKLTATEQSILAIEGEMLTTKFWIEGFKRVRLFLIQRILATLELEVNNAASALGLPNWRIAFKTETETKSGSTKFGVRIEVSSGVATGAWEVWSGGEGQRIKLAVAIGLANLIQRMAGVNFQFEVWDEPTAWLSAEGVEDLVECLRYRSDTTQKVLWLVDQRAHEVAAFTGIWRVTKTDEGSKVARITTEV